MLMHFSLNFANVTVADAIFSRASSFFEPFFVEKAKAAIATLRITFYTFPIIALYGG